MRVHVDLAGLATGGDPQIIQAEKTPDPFTGGAGQAVAINGKFTIPLPPGVAVPINANSYVLNGGLVDGGDISSLAFARLLALYPQYRHIFFNPLLTATDVGGIDPTANFTDGPNVLPSRYQTGRAGILPDSGQMPTSTAILPQNNTTTPAKPGVLITQEIDLSAYTPGMFREFMVYWKQFAFETTHDVASGSTNEPALRLIKEVDPSANTLEVFLSSDGAIWCPVFPFSPVTLSAPTDKIRLAFVNRGTTKQYLAHFACMF